MSALAAGGGASLAAGGDSTLFAANPEIAMAKVAAGEGEIITHVIFFDNENRNCQDMEENMKPDVKCESVHVDDSIKPDEYTSGTDYMQKQATAGNKYAQHIADETYICKGITDKIILTKLIPWIERTQGVENRFAVFDWDRTISVVEGLAIPPIFSGEDINKDAFIADMTTYVLGSHVRRKILIHMFQNILEKDIEVVILTNNPAALTNTPQRDTFLKMIKILIPQFKPVNLLCASGYGGKSIKFNEYLTSLNLLRGGKKRRTKTRRKTKRRRNTKRRWQKRS